MTTLALRVLGPPMGKGAATTNRQTGATFNPTTTAEWMAVARTELARQVPVDWIPLEAPQTVAVFLTAIFGRPKTGPHRFAYRDRRNDRRTRYGKKPDADNVSKIVLDTMTHAGIWRDDAIADVAVRRLYQSTEPDDVPRVEILIVWGDDLDRLPWPPDALEDW